MTMPGKEREELTHFLAEHPDVDRRLREAAEHVKEAAAEVEEALGQAPSSEPPVEVVTGKFLSTGLAEFITHTSSIANTFIQSSAAEIGRLIGKELEATEAAEPRRASSVSKSE
jgi:hypothetical protein